MREIIFEDYESPSSVRTALTEWVEAHRTEAPNATGAVEGAIEGTAVYAEVPDAFCVESTVPAEREMRELNRRFENGGQWTRIGAENLLQCHQIDRHAPERWAQWLTAPDPPGIGANSQT